MNRESLERYLHEQIPISRAMGVEVLEAGPNGVVLSAPLLPNINHVKTVFGGSASAVAMLSAWALLRLRLENENIESDILIHKNFMTFERPIVGAFTSATRFDDDSAWGKFLSTLKARKRARIKLCSILKCDGADVGKLVGHFVSILRG